MKSQSELRLIGSCHSSDGNPLSRPGRQTSRPASTQSSRCHADQRAPDSSAPPAFRPWSQTRREELPVVGCFPFPPAGGHQRQALLGNVYRRPSTDYEQDLIAFVLRLRLASFSRNGLKAYLRLGQLPPHGHFVARRGLQWWAGRKWEVCDRQLPGLHSD